MEMITTNSANQPYATVINGVVTLRIPGAYSARDMEIKLSPAKAEEIAIELNHAAKIVRGEA